MAQTTESLAKKQADAISLRNARESPLLRLPAEIRNLVFGYTFTVNRLIVDVDETLDSGKFLFNTMDSQCIANGLITKMIPITTVCRQIYPETSAIPFTLNTMEIGLDHVASLVLILPPGVKGLVRELKLYTFTYHQLKSVHEVMGNSALAAVAEFPELAKITLISLNMETQLSAQEIAIASIRLNAYSIGQVDVEQELITLLGKARE